MRRADGRVGKSYGSAAAVGAPAAPARASRRFGNELKLRHCHNTWVDQAAMPTWGQLGCNGLSRRRRAHGRCREPRIPRGARGRVPARRDAPRRAAAARPAPSPAPRRRRGDGRRARRCASARTTRAMRVAELRDGRAARLDTRAVERRLRRAHRGRAPARPPRPRPPRSPRPPRPLRPPRPAARRPCRRSRSTARREHARCGGARAAAERRDAAALRELLAAYEEHFAHEEALLDQHLYARRRRGGLLGGQGRAHVALRRHERMLAGIRDPCANANAVPASRCSACRASSRSTRRATTAATRIACRRRRSK